MKKHTKHSLQLNVKTLFKFKKMILDSNAFIYMNSAETDPTTVIITATSTVNMMQGV